VAIQDELPKSRITLTYRTTINGEPETVKLPLRLLVLGNFSHGTSVDRLKKDEKGAVVGEVDLEARRMRSVTGNNLNSVIKDMGISLTLKEGVKNWVDPAKGGESMEVTLPVSSMKSFHPDEIVKNVPKLSALLLLRKLLEEMQSNIDNRKELRKSIYALFTNEDERKKLLAEFKGYDSMQLTAVNSAPAPTPNPNPTPTGG
jgi:type VI secretion system protein ImpB